MSFWKELKRRNVYKVGVAYAIVAWLIIQLAAIVSPALQLPKWTLPLVIIFLSIGFIVALLLAWAYEVTPDGIKRTKDVPFSESIRHITGQRINYILIGVIILGVVYILFDKFYLDRDYKIIEQTPTLGEVVETQKSIAVLPFTDLSPEKDQEYFVDGLSEEILNSLAKIPDLTVIARTSSFSFKGKDKTVQEIARVLGVENILEGSVRKAGNELRITAQLVRAADGSHLWSKTYERELNDIFAVQEDIATAVADELKITLGIGTSPKVLGGTTNTKAYDLYMISKGQMRDAESINDYNSALKSIDSAIALDPKFALAWLVKAQAHIQLIISGPTSRTDAEEETAFKSIERSIELEPNIGSGYVYLGFIKNSKGEWIEAELAFRKALVLLNGSLSSDDDYIISFYQSVGNFQKASELLKQMRQHDPLGMGYPGHNILNYAYLGDMKGAEDEYQRCRATFGDNSWHDYAITWARVGSGSVSSATEIVSSNTIDILAKEYLESPEDGIIKLRRLYKDDKSVNANNYYIISMWAAYFGDTELALQALQKGVSMEASGLFIAWLPVMHEARQLPRFKEFVRKIDLVDYWNEFGWPDICRQLDNGDFDCD